MHTSTNPADSRYYQPYQHTSAEQCRDDQAFDEPVVNWEE